VRGRAKTTSPALFSDQGAASTSSAALELGYFDQAHPIRDFKAVVGLSPADYARKALAGR
jgi:AraC-like DNA-binding protein